MTELTTAGFDQAQRRLIETGSVKLQAFDTGAGEPVILCHGFPGLGYSWRYQMAPLAEQGFRAVALDMRGYGGSDQPDDPAAYGPEAICDDLLAVLDDLGAEQAVFVGHDFGSRAVYDMALRHPDRVRGLIVLSVPYRPLSTVRPTEAFAAMARDHFLHLHYFQEQGPADRELAAAPAEFLHRIFWALSGGYRYLDIWGHSSEGNGYLDVLPEAPALPWPWLSQAEFDYYVAEFTRTTFTGGLHWYRSADTHWSQMADYADAKIEVPMWFLAGAGDTVLEMLGTDLVGQMSGAIPDLRRVELVADAGHFVQMEQAAEVNRLLLEFLAELRATS